MASVFAFLAKRIITMILVLFAILVLTLSLLGPTIDNVLLDSIKNGIVEQINNNQNLKFNTLKERQAYIDNQISLQISNLGLDEPWYSPNRFINTVFKVMFLDLGNSNFFISENGSSSVRDIIFEKIPKTLLLFMTSTIVTTIIGIYLGAFLASKKDSKWDKVNSVFTVFSNSIPVWWFGMLMIFLFAFVYPIFPARSTPLTSPSDSFYFLDLLYHMVLPLITIILMGFGSFAYIVRNLVLRILDEDYIKAKYTMGISKKKIIYSHALKNAAPPIITIVGLSLAGSFGGAFTIEAVFDWPGIGKLYFDAIGLMDIPVIIGLTYISSLIFLVTVFLIDIIYMYVDPRVKISG